MSHQCPKKFGILCFALLLLIQTVSVVRAEEEALIQPGTNPEKYFGLFTQKQFVAMGTAGLTATLIFDRAIRDDVFYYRNSDPASELRSMGDVGEKAGLIFGGAFGLQGIVFRNAKSRQTSVLLLESFVVSGLIASGIKTVIGRERPSQANSSMDFGKHSPSSSFPSGHTTAAFSAATVIAEQYPKWHIAIPMYAAATVVGVSRMYASKHWSSDVVAGAFLGTAVSHEIRKRYLKKKNKKLSWLLAPTPNGVQFVTEF